MIPELGHFALIVALGVALLQVLLPSWGFFRRDARFLLAARSAAVAQFVLIALAFVCLAVAFIQNDFSVVYVAANSHSELPLMYRISAVWGAHEGSVLLWVLMLSVWTVAVSGFNRHLPLELTGMVLAALGFISSGFLLFLLLTSNPFLRQFPAPEEGQDLNPLLQDPGLAIHPPMLYMGYVGFSVAFAFAIAALVNGRLDSAWARWVRPWTTAAWTCLTLGITLGSWWAYRELGWGGWWFWDPVENASFMPWLVGTALIHSLAVSEKRGLLKSWTVLLAVVAFALSLLGTFLVRSGVLVSVHAFATDPARGVFILVFLAIVIGGALSLYAWRGPRLRSQGEVRFFSREGFLLFNNVFLLSAAAAVFLGTLYPLVVEALHLGKISVGPPYFNTVFAPLTAPLVLLVGIVAGVPWKEGRLREVARQLRIPGAVALAAAFVLPWLLQDRNTVLVAAGTALGVWTLFTAGLDILKRARVRPSWIEGLAAVPRGVWGMTTAHFGLGVFVLGVTYVSTFGAEQDLRVTPGHAVAFAGYEFKLTGVRRDQGSNYDADVGTVIITRNGKATAVLEPEKRIYHASQRVMTEAAVDMGPLRDLYVSLGDGFDDGDWGLRLYYRPFVRFIWGGGLLAFIGGLLALSDRRYRLAREAERRAIETAEARA